MGVCTSSPRDSCSTGGEREEEVFDGIDTAAARRALGSPARFVACSVSSPRPRRVARASARTGAVGARRGATRERRPGASGARRAVVARARCGAVRWRVGARELQQPSRISAGGWFDNFDWSLSLLRDRDQLHVPWPQGQPIISDRPIWIKRLSRLRSILFF